MNSILRKFEISSHMNSFATFEVSSHMNFFVISLTGSRSFPTNAKTTILTSIDAKT